MLSDIQNTKNFRMNGWHYDAGFYKDKINGGEMVSLVTETAKVCNFDCEYCFTDYKKRDEAGELTLNQRLDLIDQACGLGARTYEIIGAGEPLLDPCLWKQLEYARRKNLILIMFANGWELGDLEKGRDRVERLWNLGATIVLKWHTNSNALYDLIVKKQGAGERLQHAISWLKQAGFNQTRPTRLAFNNIIYRRTLNELPDFLRMCRRENIIPICSTFIPQGKTKKGHAQELDFNEVIKIYQVCQKIDQQEFGIKHSDKMPYLGYGQACVQYYGLYVTISGDIFGCAGQSEYYGNIKDISLAEAWRKRLPLLEKFEGGCPPRKNYYGQFVETARLGRLF